MGGQEPGGAGNDANRLGGQTQRACFLSFGALHDFNASAVLCGHLAPAPTKTTGTVRQRILQSSQSDQLSMYSRSRRTQSRKLVTLLRPLTCQRQVSPGFTERRRRCARSSKRCTSSTGRGRGPTRLISPSSTFQTCGHSSKLYLRKKRPTAVTRGS